MLLYIQCDINDSIYSFSQALTSMLEETKTGSNLSRKATLLLAEFLQTANRTLPLIFAAGIQVMAHPFWVQSF